MNTKNDKPVIALLGGTGKEGPGLAIRWASVGYPIIIGSRKAGKAQNKANELNELLNIDWIEGMQNEDAARRADISVLTVVYNAHRSALESLRDALAEKILVDATARVDFRNPVPPQPPSAARIAQTILGQNVRVVAAFQNVPAHALKKNLGGDLDTDVLVCADDIAAAEQVMQLARAGGMRAYYSGGLDNGVVVEGLTSLLISINKFYGIKTASIGITGVEQD